MTPGEKVVVAAKKYLGCREVPSGSNSGPCVRHIQSATGAYNAPWCGSFVKRAYLDAGVDDDGIVSASTWQTVENAKRAGALIDAPVTGCVIVWRPGPNGHMEIVERVVGRNSVLAIGGNVSGSVKQSYRDTSGAYIIAPKALREPPKPVYRTSYWWECPGCTPERHGLYAALASREKAARAWVTRNGNPGHVRRGKLSVVVNGRLVPRFTFWTGPRKRSADFATKAARDKSAAAYTRTHPGARLRMRSKRVRVS